MNIVTATLKRRVSRIGGTDFLDDVPLGKEYRVDLNSMRWGTRIDTRTNLMHREMLVICEDGSLLPADCLGLCDDIGAAMEN